MNTDLEVLYCMCVGGLKPAGVCCLFGGPVFESVALEERERRQRHENSENGCLPGFLPVQSEWNVARKHYEGKERDTHHISEQQHGVGVHALVVERNGESRICPVGRGSECCQKISFQVGKLHISNFDFLKTAKLVKCGKK